MSSEREEQLLYAYNVLKSVARRWKNRVKASQWVTDEVFSISVVKAIKHYDKYGELPPLYSCFRYELARFFYQKYRIVSGKKGNYDNDHDNTDDIEQCLNLHSNDLDNDFMIDIQLLFISIEKALGKRDSEIFLASIDLTASEISEKLSLSRQRVSQILARINKFISKKYEH